MFKRKLRGKRGGKITLKRLAKKVSKLAVAREIKESYTNQFIPTYSGVSGSGFQYTTQLSSVAQGDDYNNRTGRQITPVGLNAKVAILGTGGSASATTIPRICRVIIFQDMGYNGTSLTPSQLLQVSATTVDSTANALSYLNTDYVRSKHNKDGRAHILYDKAFWIHPQFSMYSSECTKYLNISVPGKKLKPISFNGVADNTAVGGSIWMYVCLGQAAASGDNAQIAFQSRLNFVDD